VRRLWTVFALVGLLVSAACSDSDDESSGPVAADGVRIASFDFAESQLLAELYGQVIEANDLPVVRMGSIGPREVVAPSLEVDRIDLVPEYLGTALQFFGSPTTDPDTTTSKAALADLVAGRGLAALDAAAAQDANAVVVTRELAADLDLARISDLSAYAADLRFGGPVECPDRPLCLVGLVEVYGLSFAEFVPQRSLAVTAEALRRDEIDVGLMFTTAPQLDETEFVELDDDLGLQPAENVIPLVRESALDRWGPGVAAALDGLSAVLTTDELREMNRLVDDGTEIAAVASSWLRAQGLVPPG